MRTKMRMVRSAVSSGARAPVSDTPLAPRFRVGEGVAAEEYRARHGVEGGDHYRLVASTRTISSLPEARCEG